MADDEISTLALTVREEQYDELADTRRPPYFGEREPTCHVITADEKIYLQPMPYTQRLIEALKFGYQLARMPVVGLRRGRPPEYDIARIVAVAEEAIRDPRGVDHHLDWFVQRVRDMLSERHIKAPKDTRLTEICEPIYKRAKAALPAISD